MRKNCLSWMSFVMMILAVSIASGESPVPGKSPFPGKKSLFNTYDRHDFIVADRDCTVVAPKTNAPGNPWIWRTEFFGHEPQADIALLGNGFHVVYIDMQSRYGCPGAMEWMDAFYAVLTRDHGLAQKTVLEGFSRGGLFAFNWAARHPEKVACIYADAPVCDFKSWPAGKGKGKGSPDDWKLLLKMYQMTEDQALKANCNPIDNLAPLARAGVQLLHVVGDADDIVPVDENTAIIEKRYKELGGHIEVIHKPGVGHKHSLKDPKPIVDFIVKAVADAQSAPSPAQAGVTTAATNQPPTSGSNLLHNVPDETFLSDFKANPSKVMGCVPESVTFRYHQPIAQLDKGFALMVDVFYRDQKPAKKRPALIFMHDWAGGVQPRLAGDRQSSYLALTENLFCVVLYYRQPVDAQFPAALQDLKCCLRWLRSIADEYAIDPDQIIVMGSSAGTQWTQLAAASNGSKDYEGSGGYAQYSSTVNAVVVLAAICDFVNDFGKKRLGFQVMGGSADEMPERYKEASPLLRINARMPPVLMIHGERDSECSFASAQAAYKRYQELGVKAELVVRPGCDHSCQGPGITLYDNLETVRQFIRRQFPAK